MNATHYSHTASHSTPLPAGDRPRLPTRIPIAGGIKRIAPGIA